MRPAQVDVPAWLINELRCNVWEAAIYARLRVSWEAACLNQSNIFAASSDESICSSSRICNCKVCALRLLRSGMSSTSKNSSVPIDDLRSYLYKQLYSPHRGSWDFVSSPTTVETATKTFDSQEAILPSEQCESSPVCQEMQLCTRYLFTTSKKRTSGSART